MTLDESQESVINDASMLEELKAGAYGNDNRPSWAGAHRPVTECAELKGLANWAATHYAYYLTFVRDFVERRGKILDVGCGCGQNTAMLARYSERALGIDPESFGIGFAKKHNASGGAEFICGHFPHGEVWERRPFDYIFCIETMEHIEYRVQEDFMQAALDLLAPDGRLFITTPNETSASGPHHGIWTPEWLGKMAAKFGERIVRRGYFNNLKADEGFVESGTHHAWVLK